MLSLHSKRKDVSCFGQPCFITAVKLEVFMSEFVRKTLVYARSIFFGCLHIADLARPKYAEVQEAF